MRQPAPAHRSRSQALICPSRNLRTPGPKGGRSIFSQIKKDIGPLKMLRPPFGPGIRKYLDGQIRG